MNPVRLYIFSNISPWLESVVDFSKNSGSRPTTFSSWIPIRELNPFAYFEKELYSVFRVYVPECLYFVHYANQILKILNIHIHVKGLLFVLFMEHAENLSQRPLNVEDLKRDFKGLNGV